jgi:F0F1-type ATP synthase assembly protein I
MLVQVEKLIQIVLLLPAATFTGWAIGLALDRWLHRHWIYVAGLLAGAAAGFVQIFRLVLGPPVPDPGGEEAGEEAGGKVSGRKPGQGKQQ